MSDRDDASAEGRQASPSEALRAEETQAYTFLTAALYAALVVGIAVTALFHDALAPSSGPFGASPATNWTGFAPYFAPLVAGAAGFYVGSDLDGQRAYLASFVGNAVGYLVLFAGAYVITDTLLGTPAGQVEVAMRVGIAVGIGLTGVLFASVADTYAAST